MYIYLDKQGVVKEIINDEALRQSASNVNEIYVYYDGLQEADIGSVLATYGLPDGTITDEMKVATRTEESEIPYNAERDLKYFQYYKAYAFYHFAIADLALSQEGVVRLMIRLAQKDGEYIKVAGLICFDVEGELVKEDHGVSLAQYNYLVKAWVDTKGFLPLDGSKAMQGNLDMGAHSVLLNGKTLKDNNGALNYNGSDLAKQSDTSSLQSQIDTINATQNVVDIVGTKAELNAYVTKDLHANDKIEVLADESQNNANTIYEWNGNVWSLVGSKAPYYSKAESDARYNELKAKSYDKDTTEYVTGHVPDSGLVKKSLNGISENLETTKIQVDTNKTNIAKNTQDIATLKANYTEVQSQTNTNSSDIALLKTNVIKTDTDASLKSLTLPSASDLKTKDGTSFGGGDTSSIPTDINIDKDFKLILEHDGVEITGQNKKIIYPFSISDVGNRYFTFLRAKLNNYYFMPFSFLLDMPEKYAKFEIESAYAKGIVYIIAYDKSMEIFGQTYSSIGEFSFQNGYNAKKSSLVILPNDTSVDIYYVLPKDKSGTIALTSDLDAKQATLYHHTITLHNATNTAYFTFSIDRTWQAEITKDTLFNVLNAYIVVGTGIVQNMLIDKISFHNTAEKTKVHQYASFGASGYVNAEVTFASVFGTDYTLEDVTYPLA